MNGERSVVPTVKQLIDHLRHARHRERAEEYRVEQTVVDQGRGRQRLAPAGLATVADRRDDERSMLRSGGPRGPPSCR